MKRTYADYIEDILKSIELINTFTKGKNFDDFKSDEMMNYAVIRAIEIIGEAAKNIPEGIRNNYPRIPWNKITGMRNRIAHEYFGISLKIVWLVCKEELPPLKSMIKGMLDDVEKTE